MDEIVHKCWSEACGNAEHVKAAVLTFLKDSGWSIEVNHKLKGSDVAALPIDLKTTR